MTDKIYANCPACKTIHTVSTKHAGKAIKCKSCGQPFRLPEEQGNIPEAIDPYAAMQAQSPQVEQAPSTLPHYATAQQGGQAVNVVVQAPPHPKRYVIEDRTRSESNGAAGVCSFFFPGLGQLVSGRVGPAIAFFLGFWFFLLLFFPIAIAIWIWSIVDAASN